MEDESSNHMCTTVPGGRDTVTINFECSAGRNSKSCRHLLNSQCQVEWNTAMQSRWSYHFIVLSKTFHSCTEYTMSLRRVLLCAVDDGSAAVGIA